MRRRIGSLMRRQVDRFAGPYMASLSAHLAHQDARIRELQETVGLLQRDLTLARQDLEPRTAEIAAELARTQLMLRSVSEEDPLQRQRLYDLRSSDEYEFAFTEAEPLVSFVIPTHTRFETLRDRALPSILSQTYANVEVIVVGDAAPPETEQAIADLGDPRVRYQNRSVRGPYPDDKSIRWYMAGSPPFNDGLALARGRWIANLGDDDSVRPEHTERLLRAAQEDRHELCYGRHGVHYRSGETLQVGSFPPVKGEFVFQSAIYHAGLRLLQMEPADYLYAEPNDWSLCRRMMQAGVRFGMVDELLADRYESRFERHADWAAFGVPSVD